MKRSTLDALTRDLRLSEPAAALALDLSGSRPNSAAWRAFAIRLMNGAGIAALGAGAIFFVAANWQDYGVLGRFALLQVAFAICIGAAWWKSPPHAIGTSALVLAVLLVGALLALFGQTYQTGADVFELFFYWAALALPLALAGRSGAAWAVWWTVLNVGLALYTGWQGPDHFMWRWIDARGLGKPLALMLPCAVNFAGAAIFLQLRRSRFELDAPRWLVRLLATFAFLYGTTACITAVVGGSWVADGGKELRGQEALAIGLYAAACIAIAAGTLRAKRDVFPMAAIIASWIAITTAVLVKNMRIEDLGAFFVVTLWLIGASTAAGYVLMKWVREWRFDEEAVETHA
jgi:Predicted membrane protein (DUF2157)